MHIHRDLGELWRFGIHWGSFPLTSEPVHQAANDLVLACARHGVSVTRFVLPPLGETRRGPFIQNELWSIPYSSLHGDGAFAEDRRKDQIGMPNPSRWILSRNFSR